jgi:hypothetical protein
MNQQSFKLNNTIGSEVRVARSVLECMNRSDVKIVFAPVTGNVDPHRICDADTPWINALKLHFADVLQTSFHPTFNGQAAYAKGVNSSF